MSALHSGQCLYVIIEATQVPIGQDLCGPPVHIIEEIMGGLGVVKGSHILTAAGKCLWWPLKKLRVIFLWVASNVGLQRTDFYRLYGCKTERYLPSGFRNSLNVGREMNVWDSERVGSRAQATSLGWQDFIQRMVSESWILCSLGWE